MTQQDPPEQDTTALIGAVRDEAASLLDVLAYDVQHIVRKQPWGRNGDEPVPVEIFFDWDRKPEPWAVKFVVGLRNSQRKWSWARGATLREALERALIQTGS
jgi:hypothetical protein